MWGFSFYLFLVKKCYLFVITLPNLSYFSTHFSGKIKKYYNSIYQKITLVLGGFMKQLVLPIKDSYVLSEVQDTLLITLELVLETTLSFKLGKLPYFE